MAKFEKILYGNFDDIIERITSGILNGSSTASLEEKSDFISENSRCSVRVFERYSYTGSNRVSLSITLFQADNNEIHLSAITAGGSQAVLFKINTFGEKAFLDELKKIIE